MRTTLDIDPGILQAAKEIAAKDKTTAGAVISRLALQGLLGPIQTPSEKMKTRNGVPVFPATGRVITLEHTQRLMDEEGV